MVQIIGWGESSSQLCILWYPNIAMEKSTLKRGKSSPKIGHACRNTLIDYKWFVSSEKYQPIHFSSISSLFCWSVKSMKNLIKQLLNVKCMIRVSIPIFGLFPTRNQTKKMENSPIYRLFYHICHEGFSTATFVDTGGRTMLNHHF